MPTERCKNSSSCFFEITICRKLTSILNVWLDLMPSSCDIQKYTELLFHYGLYWWSLFSSAFSLVTVTFIFDYKPSCQQNEKKIVRKFTMQCHVSFSLSHMYNSQNTCILLFIVIPLTSYIILNNKVWLSFVTSSLLHIQS